MTWFTLIIVLHLSQGVGGVTVPNYPDAATCEVARKAAKARDGVYDAFCLPAPGPGR